MSSFDYFLLGVIYLLQFMLPGIVMILLFAWVRRWCERECIKHTDKIISYNGLTSIIVFTFLVTDLFFLGILAFIPHRSALGLYIPFSVFAMFVLDKPAGWLMRRLFT
jgi:uncharacterized membrane protein